MGCLYILVFAIIITAVPSIHARTRQALQYGWKFAKTDTAGAQREWQNVRVPHDWAIHEPFSRKHDLQIVAVEQNGETEKTEKTGRTGGLPYMGRGVYTKNFDVQDTTNRTFTFLFDGVMSNPQVSVNGQHVGNWAYGYNSFYINIPDGIIHPGENNITVEVENKPQSSRWYPGAGLYRNVHLITTSKVHIPVWGTYITTPYVSDNEASVKLITTITGASKGKAILVNTEITDEAGNVVAKNVSTYYAHQQPFTQQFLVKSPKLWSPESPNLYVARTTLSIDSIEVDSYSTRFGIRSIQYIPEKGFFLNGKYTKFKGVCNHHDLGPLGAAVNRAALRHQIKMLKDMGANAIRTSHNMPAPELVELCDEMGMMVLLEPFDDWGYSPKSPNGYGAIFNEWAEKDMMNMLHNFRNNASVVMWSIGNEVPSQWGPDGVQELQMLLDIVHREDPTRPATCGMNDIGAVMGNGFAAALDIPGFNYKPQFYEWAYNTLPQKIILGSETASTVSSRGCYMFPAELKANATYHGNQSSSYDTEFCYWSNIPDIDFAADEDYPWMIGQFVWTGFDYLGEPTPYDTDAWPSHSSVFGIIDLASIPKDRYYLYRSQWNTDSPTLHILPHWNWKGREGLVTPVMVYASYPKAELFINGVSQGIKEKSNTGNKAGADCNNDGSSDKTILPDAQTAMNRFRLIWDEAVYHPGEVRVVAYDENDNPVDETIIRTAGKAHHLVLTPDRTTIDADGNDLVYVTIQIADKNGNIIPDDARMVNFKVSGAAEFLATANGDPTSLLPFDQPKMKLFSGAATAILRASDTPGEATLTVTASGVKPATATIGVR